DNPQHPYTVGLLQSVPRHVKGVKKRLIPIDGSPPELLNPSPGCPFAPRCPHAMSICLKEVAPLYKINSTQSASCWLHHPSSPKTNQFIQVKEDEIDG
ncbi:MAG: peptide ABC transporter ATP-binding protein, partial [bacterium]|nr:peptide ABC transporter ATP-binding protein [bacterium]